ncbi:MAG: hypothetical protein Q8L93_03615 [Rhodocyclaceae bacterium]|nr:hypothetical protein [Rhodocyclaceae bacterium]
MNDLHTINIAYRASVGDTEHLARLIESGDQQKIARLMSDPAIREIIVKLIRRHPLRKRGERTRRNALPVLAWGFSQALRESGMPAYSSENPSDENTACGRVARWFGLSGSRVVLLYQQRIRG